MSFQAVGEVINLVVRAKLSANVACVKDGEVIKGPDVYRYVMRHAWPLWPLYLFSVVPGISQLFDWIYRTFADHRYEVSEACRLPAEFTKNDESD